MATKKTAAKKTTKTKKAADKRPTIPFQTPFGEARWPNLTNPDTHGKHADGKFKTPIIFSEEDHEAVLTKMREAAETPEFKAYFEENGVDFNDEDTELKFPLREFKNKESGEVEEVGIQFKSLRRPAVFDTKRKKLPAKLKIGNTTELRGSVALFPWAQKDELVIKDAKTGKKTTKEVVYYGVSGWLNSVQIRKLVQGGGSDGSEFDDVDGFEYDDSHDDDEVINGDDDSDADASDGDDKAAEDF